MSSETEEFYPYTNFPLTREVPEPVRAYQRKNSYYPEVVIANSMHRVSWKTFMPVKGPSRVPSAALQPGQDVPGLVLPEYVVGIDYSDSVPPDQLLCRGDAAAAK